MWCFLFNYCWGNVVFLVQLLLGKCGVSCSIIVGVIWCFLFNYYLGGVSCSIIVGVMWCFLFNYCWGNLVFLVQLSFG